MHKTFALIPAVSGECAVCEVKMRVFTLQLVRVCHCDPNSHHLGTGPLIVNLAPEDWAMGMPLGELSQLLMWEGLAHRSGTTPEQVVLGYVRKQTEHAVVSKPEAEFLCGLCFSSCLWVLVLSSRLGSHQ